MNSSRKLIYLFVEIPECRKKQDRRMLRRYRLPVGTRLIVWHYLVTTSLQSACTPFQSIESEWKHSVGHYFIHKLD